MEPLTEDQQAHVNSLIAAARREGEAKASDRTSAALEALKAQHTRELEQANGRVLAVQRQHAASRALGGAIVAGAQDLASEVFLRSFDVDLADDGTVLGVKNRAGEALTMDKAIEQFKASHPYLITAKSGAGVTRPSDGGGSAPTGDDFDADEFLVEGWNEGRS